MNAKKIAVMAALLISAGAQAAVQAINWNGDGIGGAGLANTSPKQTFYDASNQLLWTNTNVWGSEYVYNSAYGQANFAEATAFVAELNASDTMSFLNNEGLHSWHIPTKAEYIKLIGTQSPNGAWNRAPFASNSHLSWTSTPGSTADSYLGFASNSGLFSSATGFASNTKLDVWAVASVAAVPEPETYAMLLAGLGLIGTIARRRAKPTLKA